MIPRSGIALGSWVSALEAVKATGRSSARVDVGCRRLERPNTVTKSTCSDLLYEGTAATPSSAIILVVAHLSRIALRGAYSGESYQAIKEAMSGNSTMTR